MSGDRYLTDTNTFIYLLQKNERAIRRLKQEHSITTPDAIIGATAIVKELPLLTADGGFLKLKEQDIVLLEI